MTTPIIATETAFVDTNVWLYAFIQTEDEEKHAKAGSAIQHISSIVTSTQVVNQVCVNLIRKLGFSETDIQNIIDAFYSKCHVVELNQTILRKASELRSKYHLSFWDSMIIAGALAGGATILYSEEMQDGLDVEQRMKIENPFK